MLDEPADRASGVRIRVPCPLCGAVLCRVDQVMLYLHHPYIERSEYAFCCPGCQEEIHCPASATAIELLVKTGVRVVRITLPAEALEAKEGPPLNWEDYSAFARALEQWDGGAVE